MNRPFNKKRFWLIVSILLIAEALGLCLAMRWKYIFPSDEVSEIYKQYANVEGIDATFIKDYKVNDTVRVDVTLLEAQTDSAWTQLTDDFNAQLPPDMPPPPPNTVDFWYAPHGNYSLPMDTILTNNDIIAVSHDIRTIAIFHIESEKQIDAILYHQITTNKKTSKNE